LAIVIFNPTNTEFIMIEATLLAIQLIHPRISTPEAKRYAKTIDEQAIVSGVDPLSFVAVIERESKFSPWAVSEDGFDYGLMQVRSTYYPHPKEWLFNPIVNIRAGAYVVKTSVDACKKHLGRTPDVIEWYSLFNGEGNKSFCRPTKRTRAVASFRDCLSNAVFGAGDIAECRKIYK
jgi:hypothetical protein